MAGMILEDRVETSCIDFILMSKSLHEKMEKAIIDSKGLHCLTKYATTKGNPSVKRSDHYSLIAYLNIELVKKKPIRKEIFKLRDADGLEKFKKLTSNSQKLTLAVERPVEDACNLWFKEIDCLLHQCFKKIKISNTPPKKTNDYTIHKKK